MILNWTVTAMSSVGIGIGAGVGSGVGSGVGVLGGAKGSIPSASAADSSDAGGAKGSPLSD